MQSELEDSLSDDDKEFDAEVRCTRKYLKRPSGQPVNTDTGNLRITCDLADRDDTYKELYKPSSLRRVLARSIYISALSDTGSSDTDTRSTLT